MSLNLIVPRENTDPAIETEPFWGIPTGNFRKAVLFGLVFLWAVQILKL